MSKEKGKENCNKFEAWVAAMDEMKPPNWTDYFYNGTLNKSKVANACGFHRDAFKGNTALIEMLNTLNKRLVSEGVYQKKRRIGAVVTKSAEQSESDIGIKDSAKIRDLKRALKRAQDENAKLTGELAKLSEFRDVLIDMGLYK